MESTATSTCTSATFFNEIYNKGIINPFFLPLRSFPALYMHTDWVRDVAWAPNLGLPKYTIGSASQDGKVVIWTVAKESDQWEGKVLKDFKTPIWRVSWSLTRNILVVVDGNNNVTLWKEAVDGEWQQLVVADGNNNVTLWKEAVDEECQ